MIIKGPIFSTIQEFPVFFPSCRSNVCSITVFQGQTLKKALMQQQCNNNAALGFYLDWRLTFDMTKIVSEKKGTKIND